MTEPATGRRWFHAQTEQGPQSQRSPKAVGRYLLCDQIAAGGMATVHLGLQLGPLGFSRTVAIKRLFRQYARDPDVATMFADEARLTARIRHPNVIPTTDLVTEGGELFVVMEYVAGQPLSVLMSKARKSGRRIDSRIVASVVAGVLHGLAAAHELADERGQNMGVIHRDISPHNVMVGADGLARLFDFGVARAKGRRRARTRPGTLKGKIAYMAPEQLHDIVSQRSDIFALSVVLWEALTNQRMFGTDCHTVLLARAQGYCPPPPSAVDPALAPFDEVVMRGLAQDPRFRYASARLMVRDVERCVGTASTTEVADWMAQMAPRPPRRAACSPPIE